MDNTTGNKHKCTKSAEQESPHKVRKMNWSVDAPTSTSSPQKTNKVVKLTTADSSINNKMNNIAKLRQQFIEEFKDVELSLKETIKSLKYKISEADKRADIMREKLREANQLLCNQTEIIYDKEQKYKALREQIEELYQYQKIIYDNMEDISNTHNVHDNLSEQLINNYDSIIIMQQNDNKLLEEKLNKMTPDEELSKELKKINLKIDEQLKENVQYQNEIPQLKLKIEANKIKKEEQKQHLKELDKKINELEKRNINSKNDANRKNNDLRSEIEKLKQDNSSQASEMEKVEKNISVLISKLETSRDIESKSNNKIIEINEDIHVLSEENKELDESHYKDEQENTIALEKLKEQLQVSQAELIAVKQKENQATDILQRKISELRLKIKNYDGLETKLEKYELEIKKEEESITQISQDCEGRKKESNNKIKLTNDKISELKVKIDNGVLKISESEERIKLLESEISKLNDELKAKIKAKEKSNIKFPVLTQNISQYNLPDLFVPEEMGNIEKQKNRKKLYTPTLADEYLEIDSLQSVEEQFTHLTQNSHSSQSESSEKARKFFKSNALSQSKVKKESTPRTKGKGKKH